MAADHPVQTLGGVPVAGLLGPAQLEEIDRHQLDLHEVGALVEHEVLVQLPDDVFEEGALLRGQEPVGIDAVNQAVLVAGSRTFAGPGLGGLADLLLGRGVAVPAVELSGIVFAYVGFCLVVSHDLRRSVSALRGSGRETDFAPIRGNSSITYRRTS
ncbi:hypothetical protein DESC_510003 [Desulfosarcina cetonica]|nr:hypothetical protein DESC_510003 [Desulfosarcina cetonica]